MQGSSTRPRHAFTHFCCYLPYFVHVTFATLQRNGRFFQICCKLQYKINVFPPKVDSGPDSLRKSPKGLLRAIWGLALWSFLLCHWLLLFSSIACQELKQQREATEAAEAKAQSAQDASVKAAARNAELEEAALAAANTTASLSDYFDLHGSGAWDLGHTGKQTALSTCDHENI